MNLLATQRHYWVDRLDPWIVHFSGDFGIRWYAIGIIVAIRQLKQGAVPKG